MVLAHKERLVPRLSQRDLSRARFASDHPFPLPGPGVFAAGDSIARGALLPDGTVAPSSPRADAHRPCGLDLPTDLDRPPERGEGQ